MSNYTKQISWSGKDALSDSDPEKVISGGDFDTEFSAVQTAINSKIDGGTITNFTSTGIDDNATSTAITINASENVGIGVVPEAWGSNYKALQIGDKTSLTDVSDRSRHMNNVYEDTSANMLRLSTSLGAVRYDQYDGEHIFKVAGTGTGDISWTTAMSIDNSGEVHTGTFSATGASYGAYLHDGILRTSRTGTGVQPHHRFYNANGLVGNISTSGSSTSYNTSSDYRLKELDVPMEGSIDRLKLLRPINFAWKADGSRVDGFLAHEAQEVVPEAVTGTKDAMMDEEYEVTPAVMDGETVVTEAVMGTRSVPDYQGIDQSKLSPLLVASLQEAVAKIEALEARVTALEV